MLKNYKKTTKTHNEKSRKPNGSTTFYTFQSCRAITAC